MSSYLSPPSLSDWMRPQRLALWYNWHRRIFSFPGWDPVHQDGCQSGRNCDQARVPQLLPQQPHSDPVDVCSALKLHLSTFNNPPFYLSSIDDKLCSLTVLHWKWLESEKFNERPVNLSIIYSKPPSPLDGQAVGEFLHWMIICQDESVPEILVPLESPVTQQAMEVGIILGQGRLHPSVGLFQTFN